MERTKITLILILLFSVLASIASEKRAIYESFRDGDMVKWKRTIDLMEKQNDKSDRFLIELLDFQYGYIAYCIGNNDMDQAKKYYKKGKELIKILDDKKYQPSMINAYKAAFYGYAIGFHPYQAPIIGPRSIHCAREAMKLDSENPFGFILFGHIRYYMPVIFGGSKKEAIEYYTKAAKMMEADTVKYKDDWNYLGILITIAEAYTEIGDNENAKFYFEKILKFEPELFWVKNELYPEFLKKLKKNE